MTRARTGTRVTAPVVAPRRRTTMTAATAAHASRLAWPPADTDALVNRLRRIEGQVRGLQRMVAADAYCIDVLTQVAAATRALEAVAVQLLGEHLRRCVTEAAAAGGPDTAAVINEASGAIQRLVHS